jgi:acyl dehydratase
MQTLASATAADYLNQEVALTDWLTITQEMVTGFAESSLDPDWMHVDVERSRREGPFGGTIVQGFLMSSLVIYFSHQSGVSLADAVYALNYGTDRVRYLRPVLTGSRVRDRIVLADFQERGEGRYLMKTHHTIEVEGSDKPAAVVDSLVLYYLTLDY